MLTAQYRQAMPSGTHSAFLLVSGLPQSPERKTESFSLTPLSRQRRSDKFRTAFVLFQKFLNFLLQSKEEEINSNLFKQNINYNDFIFYSIIFADIILILFMGCYYAEEQI